MLDLNKLTPSGLSAIFKGGVGSGIRGHRTYRAQQPKKSKHWQDVSEQLDKNLLEIADGKAKRVLTQGQFNEKNIKSIINNMRSEADLYTSYLASDTAVKLRDMTSIYENILYEGLRNGEFKDINTKDLDDFGIDNIKKMVHQEVESNRQQFTDHGIRHIFGNTQRQIEIMEQMGKASAIDKLSAMTIMVNHDMGYTTAAVRKGGVEGIKASSDHKTFSGEIINSQRPILNEGKLFSSKQFDRISEAIKTHDSAKFSKDNLLNSTRISDNLALFAKEKLPSMFKYVKGGAMDLVNMGEAAKNNDVKSFEVLRTSLYKKIDASNLNVNLKRDLKAGVREISLMTPKFSMGTLAGEIDSISGGEGKVNVTIKYSKWDAFLQTRFDMGQKQTKKLLNDYGITDFSKTNYSIGGVVNLKVVGASGKEIGLSAIFKHLPGKHDQRTHAPGGFVNQDGRKVPKYDPQGTYPLYHNTPGMYLPSILRLGIGETDKYSPLRGTETLKHDSRTSWTRDSGYTSVAGQWTPDRARLTINNKQDLIKDGLSTEPAVASLATDMQADKFIPAYFEHEEAVYGIIKPSMISRIDITQVDYDKMLRDRKNFVEWGEKAKNKPVRVGKEEFDREMNKISYESNKRAVADLDLVLNDKRLVVGEIKPIYKILGLSSFTKAKSKITYSPVDKDKHEFQFRESTSKNEKKLQKIIQDFFEDQKKEVLGLLKKDFEEIEQKHLLGQHDQLSHGGGGKGSVDLQKEGAVYVYRGEYIGLKDKILKNGIPKKSWNNRPASVYMTTDEKEAHMYGIDKSFDINKNAEAWEYLVVKIKIPKNEKIIPDERDTIHYGRPSAIRIEKSIPKDWIFDVSSYRGFDSYFGKTSAEIADIMMKKSIEENFAYITFVIVPELEVELSKSFYPLDTVEEQLLLPSLGLSRLLPPRKRVLRKGGPGSGNWEGPGDPRYAYESDGGEFTNKGGYNKTTGKINPPDRLFYKCSNPKVIIDSGVIKISEIYGGVSLTTNPKLKAHGNSLIEFKRTSWFDNGVPVLYLEGYERLGTNRLSPFKSYKDQFENIYTKEEVDNIPMKISSDYKGFPIKGNNMFRNEEEWRFSDNIKFSKDDIIGVRETKSLTKASPNSFPDRFGLSAIFKGGPGSGNFGHEGRPGEVGGSSSDNGEILYHGTSSKTINSILKNGLIPGGNHIRMPWADEFADSVYGAETEGRELSVFMTKSKSAAKTFAEIASRTVGGKPLILVIRLPNDKIDRLKQDERTPTALRYEGVILPEYISVLKKKDVSVIFYAVVLEKKIKEEKTFIPFSKASPNSFPDRFGLSSIFKGGPGSGNYGHEGRPGQIGGSGSGERGVFTEEEKIKDWQENGINAQAFKEWFGNSKVIDVNGNPLVVYHGTFRDFDKFGSYNSDYMSLDSMHRYFFTDNPGHAEQFIYDESRRSGIEEKPNIMPVYLSIQKPYESENPAGELVDLLKKQGYDGIHSGGIWIAFMPTQIKSAIGNQGTFDSKNPNINKSFLFKEIVTDRFDFSGWSFDKEVWNKRLQEEGGLFIKEMYDQQGTAAYDGLKYYVADLVGVFNMDDPRVQKFLKNYIFTFAKGINDTTEELLREAMQSGMAEGLGMDGIASKIEGLYDTWGKWRSLLIARTETIRASNGATAMAYEQSGVVSGKEWLVTIDDRTCSFCLPMDGKIVDLNKNFFDKGDSYVIGEGDNKVTMKLDYEDVGYPPLHPNCRCTLVPHISEEYQIPKSLGLSSIFKGGPGSGNFGHEGRPGEVGGSGVGSFGDGILNLTPEQLADSKRANEILDKDVFRGGTEFVIENKKFVQEQISNAIKDHPYFNQPEKDLPANATKVGLYVKNEIDLWSVTSGDTDIRSVGLQIVAKEIFGLDEATLDHLGAKKLIDADQTVKDYVDKHENFQDAQHNIDAERPLPFNQDGTYKLKDIQGRFLQAQYDATQKYFKDNNIKELILYRGVEHNDGGKLRTEDVFLQPMSSFSTKANIALHFAKITTEDVTLSYRGTLYSSIVPVEKILSHPRTGFGCTNEKEVVVLGGKMKATVVPTKIARDVYLTATAAPNSSGTFNDRFIDALSKVTPEFRKEIGLSRIFKHFEGTEYDHNQSTHGGAIGQRNKTD